MSKKLTISSWSLMFAPKRSSRTTKVPAAPINILKAEFDNLRASQLQIPHKPKNGEVRKVTSFKLIPLNSPPIVSIDPIYAYFSMDELAALRYQRLLREGKETCQFSGWQGPCLSSVAG